MQGTQQPIQTMTIDQLLQQFQAAVNSISMSFQAIASQAVKANDELQKLQSENQQREIDALQKENQDLKKQVDELSKPPLTTDSTMHWSTLDEVKPGRTNQK